MLLHAPAAAHIGFWNLSTNSSTALPLGGWIETPDLAKTLRSST